MGAYRKKRKLGLAYNYQRTLKTKIGRPGAIVSLDRRKDVWIMTAGGLIEAGCSRGLSLTARIIVLVLKASSPPPVLKYRNNERGK